MRRSIWILIICAGSIMALSVGFRQAMGLFLTPITLDLGLGRESFALGMGLMNLFWGLGAPMAGAIADRHGAGRVAVTGGLLYATGLLTMIQSGEGAQLLIGGTLIGLGLSGSGFTVILGTVGRLAPPENRAQALALASVGGSIGQFLALPYTHVLIDGFGWMLALVILAASALLIIPLATGLRGQSDDAEEMQSRSAGAALKEACQVPGFWLLNAGFFVCGFHLAFVAVHIPAYLADKSFAPWLATAALTTIGLSNIIGSYSCGALGGYFPKKYVLSGIYLGRALIFYLFLVTPISETTVLIFSAAIGLLWLGTVPLTSGLVGHIFGTQHMSMLFGFVFLGHQFGGFLGAWLAGSIFDTFGSYDAMWWLSIALGILSAALHWPIAEKPVRSAAIL
jgi:predicted MFS family arabinose efflux permease